MPISRAMALGPAPLDLSARTCNPISAKHVPVGDGWVHEVKFDGYRVQAHKMGSRVAIFSRYAEHTIMRTPRQELRPAAAFS